MLGIDVPCKRCSDCATWHVVYDLFFFQAEDGIRDADVTGVQTCALPIFARPLVDGIEAVEDEALPDFTGCERGGAKDRKSVVEGKSVDLGGRRIIKKKNGPLTEERKFTRHRGGEATNDHLHSARLGREAA